MKANEIKFFKKLGIQAALKAGKLLLKEFKRNSSLKISYKANREIVTSADKEAERIILDLIRKRCPAHQILSEEVGKIGSQSDYLWVIDPLDGTTNFSMKNPLFATAISLTYQEEIIFSVIYAPFLNEFYLAEKNKGAFLNNKKISVSSEKNISYSLLTFCGRYVPGDLDRLTQVFRLMKPKGHTLREIGSASLELAFVASGRTEAIVLLNTSPWDGAAGTLLVREAGGKVTDFQGKDWTLDCPEILATNGLIHQELQKDLESYSRR